MHTLFKEYFEVRDNEIDIQGIVNNSNYLNYLCHTRHKYIQQIGIDFNEYAARDIHFVMIECNLEFKQSLRPKDIFYVTCSFAPMKSPIRIGFEQEIRLKDTDQLMMKALTCVTCVNANPKPGEKKIFVPNEIKKIIGNLCTH